MHSWNALSGGDIYGQWYGTGYFYEQAAATAGFDNRLRYVLNHVHTTLGKPWKELSDYIFAFEAENEAMIGKGQQYIKEHQNWQCDRATTTKGELGSNSGILVTTGGESWMDESVQDGWLSCAALDVIAIHAYGTGDFETSAIQTYVRRAQAAGKKFLFQEWGSCYFTTENKNCPSGSALSESTRNANIQKWVRQITAAGVPWLYWQVLPNNDPHYGSDYEVGVGESGFRALSTVAQEALDAPAASDYLLVNNRHGPSVQLAATQTTMKIFSTLFSALCALHIAYAANSFSGSNLYYAAGLSSSQRTTLLDALQSAGMKVLRVWLDGESAGTTKNTPITTYPALEHAAVGQYDPTVLNLLDAFMVDAHAHGIKASPLPSPFTFPLP
ncbi:hypothetical protein EWM64_g8071 [Hericium alpestre]|uniref:Asl1-like glycosyl hydrolase catalytic domain-containing protein n=1 Tax=Hericium alpestre TaxID=135208 RepID=A0A4Y9ZQ35_9AGAM|nr:hypothetical protein EWM64_g8071 [Hericium alpestre]